MDINDFMKDFMIEKVIWYMTAIPSKQGEIISLQKQIDKAQDEHNNLMNLIGDLQNKISSLQYEESRETFDAWIKTNQNIYDNGYYLDRIKKLQKDLDITIKAIEKFRNIIPDIKTVYGITDEDISNYKNNH